MSFNEGNSTSLGVELEYFDIFETFFESDFIQKVDVEGIKGLFSMFNKSLSRVISDIWLRDTFSLPEITLDELGIKIAKVFTKIEKNYADVSFGLDYVK